jgi:catabolite regulation protein CreA
MQAALSPEQFKALRDLAEVLEASGRAKKLGSDTAFNQLINEELFKNPPVTGVTTGIARATGVALQPLNWGKMISDWAIRRDAAANAENIANIITSPDGISRLRELRQMSPTSAKRWAGTAQLLADYGILESRE